MKYLFLIGDGMADFPLDELDGCTPLEAAATPAMDTIVRRGLTGLFCPIPEGQPPGSDVGNLSLFGYDPAAAYTGRAPLEAARQGIALADSQVAFRCNLVTLADGRMKSFTSDHISTPEAAELIDALNSAFSDSSIRFYPGVSYRHLTVVSPREVAPEDLSATVCVPPHDISDQAYEPHLPAGPAGPFLRQLMERSQAALDGHPVNRARLAAGKLPTTSIWLWGQGRPPAMASYGELFGLTGAVISAVDLVKGIGVYAGLRIVDVVGATGYLDTNYAGKVAAAFDALRDMDFVYLHVEAPDETAHEGRVDLKIKAIEDFDREVVGACLQRAGADPVRILVAPDHVTAIRTKTHAAGPVPFALCGPGVSAQGRSAYSEAEAARTNICILPGHLLPRCVLTAHTIAPEVLTGLAAASC